MKYAAILAIVLIGLKLLTWLGNQDCTVIPGEFNEIIEGKNAHICNGDTLEFPGGRLGSKIGIPINIEPGDIPSLRCAKLPDGNWKCLVPKG